MPLHYYIVYYFLKSQEEFSAESASTQSGLTKVSNKRASSTRRPSSRRQPIARARKSRPVRQSRRPPARVTDAYTGSTSSNSESDKESVAPLPVARSRTRMGYQNTQSSLWTLEDVTDQGTIPANASAIAALTPEQLEIRQRRIERRRESAKNKAEKEMQETVERLLRVNTEYNGSRGRSRKEAVSAPAKGGSDSDNSGEEKKNALHPTMPLDPPAGSVRFISSSRLQPHCVITLPVGDPIFQSQKAPSPPKPQLCDQCHTSTRRYTCARTGRGLCSLECFKAS